MANAGMTGERFFAQTCIKIAQLALGATARELALLQRGDACGIIAAIFKTLQRLDDLARDRLASENAHNAAHKSLLREVTRLASFHHALRVIIKAAFSACLHATCERSSPNLPFPSAARAQPPAHQVRHLW